MAKVVRAYVLSYQVNAHLYEKFDVKRKIVTALVKSDAIQLYSFTDSTIYFKLKVKGDSSIREGQEIISNAFKVEKITLMYTLASLRGNDKSFAFYYKEGDADLNSRFQTIVKEVRVKEKKPETL